MRQDFKFGNFAVYFQGHYKVYHMSLSAAMTLLSTVSKAQASAP